MTQDIDFAAHAALDLAAPASQGVQASQQGNDLVWGARAIGDEIGRNVRAVFHLAATGVLPIHKRGGRLVASRAQLRAAIIGE